MLPGRDYAFNCTVTSSGRTSVGTVSFRTFAAPKNGECAVTPLTGASPTQDFVLSCSEWELDPELDELQYSFYQYKDGDWLEISTWDITES